jgi:hypothetical protein
MVINVHETFWNIIEITLEETVMVTEHGNVIFTIAFDVNLVHIKFVHIFDHPIDIYVLKKA